MVAKLWIWDNLGFDQVRGRDCKGINGALVEVWYAGGEPGVIVRYSGKCNSALF